MRVFMLTAIISVALVVAGFIIPPTGIVDGSVLTAVGELLAFGVVAQLPDVVKAGRSVKIRSGEFEAEVREEVKAPGSSPGEQDEGKMEGMSE